MQTDYWCPNCKQLVRPTMEAGLIAKVVALAIFFGAAFYFWGSPDYLTNMLWGGGAALLAGGILAAMTMTRSCPLCKTTSLQRQPPATG